MGENDRRSQSDIDQGRRSEETATGDRRRDDRIRQRRDIRDSGAWPYAGPLAAGYRGPGYPGYPGYMSYPWSRFSHGMDPSYEDWQGPGFGSQTPASWEPRVERYERDDKMVVRLELPGWDKDEVTVAVEDDDLVIEGQRQESSDDDDDRYRDRRSEGVRFAAQRFSTRVPLPMPVDPSEVKAKFKNGILELRIPTPERQTERRTVKIDT
jgi:HSP20 family molecular chaperone IbpA